MDDTAKRHDDDVDFRDFAIPEEDRHLFTSIKWDGGYRQFRSPNVVCLERYRGASATGASPPITGAQIIEMSTRRQRS